jgi:feruloyl esterase
MKTALQFPEDFDGFVAGAPAVDFNNLNGVQTMLGRYVGAPNPNGSSSFIPASLWPVISQEILRQCDELDGVKDGVITDPDICNFRPEAILCSQQAQNQSECITPAQADALNKIYQPLFGTQGELLFPGYDPLAESAGQFTNMFSGNIFSIARVSRPHLLTARLWQH